MLVKIYNLASDEYVCY